MSILKTLKWSNCFSYGLDNELILDEEPLIQLVGENGSGKSSIPLIIEELIYNKNSKGIKKADIQNRYADSPYYMELEFIEKGDTYTIKLTRTKTLKISLFKNDEDISSHTATNTFKQIEKLIGKDFKTFTTLIYQSTTNNLAFLTATDTERKKFLIDLFDLHKYVEHFEVFKELLKKLLVDKTSTEAKISTYNSWVDNNTDIDLQHLPLLDITIDTKDDEEKLASVTSSLEKIKETNSKIEKNNLYKKQLSSIKLDKYNNIVNGSIKTYDEETKKLGSLETDSKTASILIKKIGTIGNKCPQCLQEVDQEFKNSLINENKRIIEESKVEIETLNGVIEDKKLFNKLLREKLAQEELFSSTFKLIDNDLPAEFLEAENLQVELNKLRKIIKDKKDELKAITKENETRNTNNIKLSLIKEQKEKIIKQLEDAEISLIDILEEVSYVEVLKKSFSTNGLIAYKLESLIKELQVITNDYLLELSEGRFAIDFVIEKDKLNVNIIDKDIVIDIAALSSGELAKVNIATLLAIRKLINSLSQSQLNVLFLDEAIAVLDKNGRERLVEVLLQEVGLNTFIVSHEWTHPLISKASVIKEKEISRIEYG